jgi:rhodanese-related sulfurtransferase
MNTQITVTQLQRLVGTPSAPVIIDVCLDADFNEFPYVIPTAIRCAHDLIHELVADLVDCHVVVVCQKGMKLSEGAAAILRAGGVAAEHLKGGMQAWQQESAVRVRHESIPPTSAGNATLWVTRSRPKIDRIACPWLIRRFVDKHARFLFVSGSQVKAVAARFAATPFDVDDVVLGHRGQQCTFDAMLTHFDLHSEPLSRIANAVRAADTNRHELDEIAAGLHAVSLGLSRMYRDDLEQLDAGLLIYDALYLWARDATDESHNSTDYKAPGRREP